MQKCRCDTLGGVQVLIELSEAGAARFVYYLGFSITMSLEQYIRLHYILKKKSL